MVIQSIQNINPIDVKKEPLISEEFVDIDLPRNSLVINVYDALDNFLLQQIYKPSEYVVDFDSEESFLQNIQRIISTDNNLNQNGIYNLEYYFVNDVFKSLDNQEYNFIVTEVSSDRREVRINPKSNDVDFIDDLNQFKNYIQINVDLRDKINQKVEEFINTFSDDFYNKIPQIISTIQIETDSGNIDLLKYIFPLTSGDFDEQGFLDGLVSDVQKTKDNVTKNIKLNIVKKSEYKQLIDNYSDSPNEESLNSIETYVFGYFKSNLYTEIDKVLEISLLGLE